ncbi:MAG TPA: hypothetical protein VLS49_11945 [Usitatibacter sp.]|nr:hypothetical protein [Usitatibacter sp.]
MIRPWPALLLALALDCAAAGNPLARYVTLSAPDCTGVENLVAEDAPAPTNATYVRVQHIGDPGTAELAGEIAHPVTWDVGAVSGYHATHPALAQRGYLDVGLPAGASAFQLECGAAGFLINTWLFPHRAPLVGEGPSASIARDLAPQPRAFPGPGWALRLVADVSVPLAHTETPPVDEGTAQVSFFYYVQDSVSGIAFAHLAALFENRPPGVGGSGVEDIGSDGVTAFATSPMLERDATGAPVRYLRVPPGSATMRFGETWSTPRRFVAQIPYSSFRELLARLRSGPLPQISGRPEDYRIMLFGVLGEVFPGTGDAHNVALGASVTGLSLQQEPPLAIRR